MKHSEKTIVTCAITGSVHTPSMSPHLPITSSDIAEQSIAAVEAGAAILHLHARDPVDGRPTASPDAFMDFLPMIKERTDAVINITTGGGATMTLEERLAAPHRIRPEMTSLNMGSMNFGLFQAAKPSTQWRFDWEKDYLLGTYDTVAYNTFEVVDRIIREIGDGYGTRFECECYDVGQLYNLAYFADRGLLKPPFLIQCIFGLLGGIGADPVNLTHMVTIADKLFGDDYYLSVLAAGRHQIPFACQSAAMGGNVRVGLEDSLYSARGVLAKNNAEQVTHICKILRSMSRDIASPSEARAMLKLKGADSVGF